MLSLLERHYAYSNSLHLNSSQLQMDEVLSHFSEQACDWRSLAAMTLGGFAYRVGKLGALSSGAKLSAPLFGLASEVAVFRGVSSLLGSSNSLSYLTTYLEFASLKIFCFAARNTNPLLSHFIQDAGMVAGHHLTYTLNLTTAPQGNIKDQLLHAEITNLQMGFGMAMCHQLTQGRILNLEKGFDIAIESKVPEPSHFLKLKLENFPQEIAHMNAAESSIDISPEQIAVMNRIAEAARQEREALASLQETRKILLQNEEGEVELISTHHKQVLLKLKGQTYVLVSVGPRNYQFNKVGTSGGLLLPISSADPIASAIHEWFQEGRIVIEKPHSSNDISAHYPRMMELQESYLDQLRAQNAVVSEEKIPLWKFVENLESVPEWLRMYAQANPYLEVQKINFVPDRLGEEGGKGAHFLANMLRDVQINWQLPIASLSNLYRSGEEYVLALSLLPAPLLMESRHLLPERHPVNLSIGQAPAEHEEVVAMMAENTRPFLIADRPNALHSLKDLHPFIQMIHDYAHLLIMDKLSPQQRSDLLTIYESCARLTSASTHSSLNDETLGRILEGTFSNPGNNLFVNLFNMVKNPHLPVDFLIAWRTELERSFPEGHPSQAALFSAFEQVFGKTIREYLAIKAANVSENPLGEPSSRSIRNLREKIFSIWGSLYLRGTAAQFNFSPKESAELYYVSPTANENDKSWYKQLKSTFFAALDRSYHHSKIDVGYHFGHTEDLQRPELRLYGNNTHTNPTLPFETHPHKPTRPRYEQAVVNGNLENTFSEVTSQENHVEVVFTFSPTAEEAKQAETQAIRFIENNPEVRNAHLKWKEAIEEKKRMDKILEEELKTHRLTPKDPNITAKIFVPPSWAENAKVLSALHEAEENFFNICWKNLAYQTVVKTEETSNAYSNLDLWLTHQFLGEILWQRFYGQLLKVSELEK